MDASIVHQTSNLPIIHRRRWGSWVLGAIVLACVASIAMASLRAQILDFAVFRDYIFSPLIVMGAINALVLGTLALIIATLIGFVSALMRVSGNPILSGISAIYVYLFRGTPMLIQLIFWFNAVPIMFPSIYIALPFMELPLIDAPTTSVVTPFLAALAGLSLAEGAYMSEIIRGGILAVDKGQREAATALGMTQRKVLTQVVIPQAGRIIIPAAGNQYIMLLKSSSLASAIGYLELLRVATDIYSSNFHVVELLAVAAFWYLVMTAFATAIQTTLEKVFPQR
ncbi:ABC transporter permease [Ochrobactrum sp. P6BS-III]|uniref:Amino acid ABC transporter permease n=2 Tax=Brucella/Ochrobactrum group TaxID=2826938 RepID=A0ABX1DUS3_9HYPH|nr:amino acid ABC transporter permease [Brucella haematophila]NKC04997.1 amino acid ABC transporter permease [Brucella haematophila]OOL15508.1 ABC transporter permease [Ochrobactrum sp. P6BS-III]TMV04481.1 amino acid ABC transporter permease [Brucella haematophila]